MMMIGMGTPRSQSRMAGMCSSSFIGYTSHISDRNTLLQAAFPRMASFSPHCKAGLFAGPMPCIPLPCMPNRAHSRDWRFEMVHHREA